MSSADIVARIANGTVERYQDVIHHSAPQLIMELIRNFIPTAEAERFIDLPMSEQVAALNRLASDRVAVKLDPIQQAQQDLLNGII
jgi:hypothetical protein